MARAVMEERLGLELERHEAGLPLADVNVLGSAPQAVRMSFDLMAAETDEQRGHLRARLEAVPAALSGLADTYREGVRRGILPARRQVLGVAAQCRQWAGQMEGSGYFSALAARLPDGDDLAGSAAAADAAYGELARFLAEELAPFAPPEDPVGPERYGLEARTFTGASLDLEDTYAWAWDELAGIERERASVATSIVSGGSAAEAAALLDADPARVIRGIEALRAWMQDLSDRALATLHGTHFDIPGPVRTLRCAIAPPGGNAGAYYTGPSEDLARPGTMWWAPAPGQDEFSTWREVTTVSGWRQGERWTAPIMEEFPAAHPLLEPAYVTDEVNRYLGLPGQAISYKVGERVWLEGRADARRRQDGSFDLKAFHAAALGLGPMGLDLLRGELARLG